MSSPGPLPEAASVPFPVPFLGASTCACMCVYARVCVCIWMHASPLVLLDISHIFVVYLAFCLSKLYVRDCCVSVHGPLINPFIIFKASHFMAGSEFV